MRRLGLLATLLAACRFSSALPEGVEVDCSSGQPCPQDYVCQVGLSRCVPTPKLDSTPPGLQGVVQVRYVPDHDNPVPMPSALTSTSVARIAFTVSEPLAAEPVVTSSTPLDCLQVRTAEEAYELSCRTRSAAPLELTATLTVLLRDLASNTATAPLASLDVDTVQPAPPDTLGPQAVIYRREPYGSEASQGVPRFTLRGARAAAPGAMWVMARSGSLDRGHVDVDSDGGFAPGLLQPVDEPVLEVAAVDSAGNISPWVAVHDVEWLATAVNKRPGSFVDNPHRVQVVRAFGDVLERADAVESGGAEGLDRIGGAALHVEGSGSWRELVFLQPTAFEVWPTVAFDEARARVVAFGGITNGILPETIGEWNGTRWSGITPVDLEGDGRPAGRYGASVAWDERRQRVVVFGGHTAFGPQADMWSWSGRSFARLPDGPAPLADAALWFDRRHGRFVVHGGVEGSVARGDTWVEVPGGWQPLDAGPGPPARRVAGSAWDDAHGTGWLLGGTLSSGAPAADFWRFDGERWSKVPLSTFPPLGDAGVLFAWDMRRGMGVAASAAPDFAAGADPSLYELDGGVGWRRIDLTALSAPPSLHLQGLVYDAARGQTVIVGVANDGVHTWTWDGAALGHVGRTSDFDRLGSSAGLVCRAGAPCVSVGTAVRNGTLVNDTFDLQELGWTARNADPMLPFNSGIAATLSVAPGGEVVLIAGLADRSPLTVAVLPLDGGWRTNTLPAGVFTDNQIIASTWTPSGLFLATIGTVTGLQANPPNGGLTFGPALPAPIAFPLATTLPDGRVAMSAVLGLDGGPQSVVLLESSGNRFQPLAALPPSGGRSIAWDPVRQTLVLFGGLSAGLTPVDSTYEVRLDGGWEEVHASDPEDDGKPSGRCTRAFAWDDRRQAMVMAGGVLPQPSDDLWQFQQAPHRPAVLFRVELEAARAPPGAKWTSWAARVSAGGHGEGVPGVSRDGFELYARALGRWALQLSSPAPVGSPSDVRVALQDAGELDELLTGRTEAVFALTPAGTNGREHAELAVDYLELELGWRQ